MTRTKEYDYDEVLEIYKKLSNEKGRPLKYLEIDECNELPSKGWVQQNGGMAKIKDELGLNRNSNNSSNSTKTNTFCIDCTKNSASCGNDIGNCPLQDEADLYFTDIEKNKAIKKYSKTYLSDQKLDEAIELKNEGMYWKDIAAKFGIKTVTLQEKVQRYMGDDWENRGWK